MNTTNPFKGAAFYSEDEKGKFFGRDADGAHLFGCLLADREVVLHAPSGSGKSSLVRAGLLPRLRERGFVSPREPLRPSSVFGEGCDRLSPEQAQRAVWRWLAQAYGSRADHAGVDSCETWHSAVRGLGSEAASPIAIIIDQTEEIFTTPGSSLVIQRAFFDVLGQAARADRVRLLIIVREDFLARLLTHQEEFVTELRSRFSLALFDAEAVEIIVASTARSVDVEVTPDTLAAISRSLLEDSVFGQDREYIENLRTARVIEPLFLQLFCADWWNQAGGDPSKLEKQSRSSDLEKALKDYVDSSVNSAADAVQRAGGMRCSARKDVVRDAVGVRSRLREWLEQKLTRGNARSVGHIDAEFETAVVVLEHAYLIRRSQSDINQVELAHDRLVSAVRASNEKWRAGESNSLLWKSYFRWQDSDRNSGELLSISQALINVLRLRKLPSELKRYWGRSMRLMLLALGTVAGVGVVAATFAGVAAVDANSRWEALANFHSAQRAQQLVARAWGYAAPSGAKDTGLALSYALAARLEAQQTGPDALDFTSRAEAVIGRALAAPVAVQYSQHDPDSAAAGCRLDAVPVDSDPGCLGSASIPGQPFVAYVTSDRNDGWSPGDPRGRHNFSFLSILDPNDPSTTARRLWLTFEDEALIEKHTVVLGFPPKEMGTTPSRIVAGAAWWNEPMNTTLHGFSLSFGGRFFAWSVSRNELQTCLADDEYATRIRNERCRIIHLDGVVQLFDEPLASIGPVQRLDGDFYDYEVEVVSQAQRVARVVGRQSPSPEQGWPSVLVRDASRGYWSRAFFQDGDSGHVWLVANALPLINLSTSPLTPIREVSEQARAMWCDDASCSARVAYWIDERGDIEQVSLDATGETDRRASRTGLAQLCGLRIHGAIGLDGNGTPPIVVGTLASNANCASPSGPLLGRVVRGSGEGAAVWSVTRIDTQKVLPDDWSNAELVGLAQEDDLLGLVTGDGRAAICDVVSPEELSLSGCRRLAQSVDAAMAIAITTVPDGGGQIVAVADSIGDVSLYDRDGKRLFPSKSGTASYGTTEAAKRLAGSFPLWLAAEGQLIRAVSTGTTGRVRMRLFELNAGGEVTATAPTVIAASESAIRAMHWTNGRLYLGSELTEVSMSPVDPAQLVDLACKTFEITPVTVGRDPYQRRYEATELCPRAAADVAVAHRDR